MLGKFALSVLKSGLKKDAVGLFRSSLSKGSSTPKNTRLFYTKPIDKTTGGKPNNFFNGQRSCCPMRVCGTPACPLTNGEILPNGRVLTFKPVKLK
jgi:hypothetical protein